MKSENKNETQVNNKRKGRAPVVGETESRVRSALGVARDLKEQLLQMAKDADKTTAAAYTEMAAGLTEMVGKPLLERSKKFATTDF